MTDNSAQNGLKWILTSTWIKKKKCADNEVTGSQTCVLAWGQITHQSVFQTSLVLWICNICGIFGDAQMFAQKCAVFFAPRIFLQIFSAYFCGFFCNAKSKPQIFALFYCRAKITQIFMVTETIFFCGSQKRLQIFSGIF